MEEADKGCLIIRMGVSGWEFLLVPAHTGSPGQRAIKGLCVCANKTALGDSMQARTSNTFSFIKYGKRLDQRMFDTLDNSHLGLLFILKRPTKNSRNNHAVLMTTRNWRRASQNTPLPRRMYAQTKQAKNIMPPAGSPIYSMGKSTLKNYNITQKTHRQYIQSTWDKNMHGRYNQLTKINCSKLADSHSEMQMTTM